MLRFIGIYNYTVILTYLSVVFAVIGMVMASNGAFSFAVLCLMSCGICDAFDGSVARSKKDRTQEEKDFGIQIDSLCDVISFGIFPAVLSYYLGADGILGIISMCTYVLCAVIRLAYFNVLEVNRQHQEEGCNKTYRGLPVTSISIIFPMFYLLRSIVPAKAFVVLLHALLLVVAYLFILDFSVKKISFDRFLVRK